jgi:hypothetical protein
MIVSPRPTLGRPAEDFPIPLFDFLQEKKLNLPTVLFPPDFGRDNLGVVEDEDISSAQISGQVLEMRVDDRSLPPPHNHHLRVVPAGKWFLSDEIRGEVVVEVRGQQIRGHDPKFRNFGHVPEFYSLKSFFWELGAGLGAGRPRCS